MPAKRGHRKATLGMAERMLRSAIGALRLCGCGTAQRASCTLRRFRRACARERDGLHAETGRRACIRYSRL
jgi:hypothetical protein